MAKSSGGGASGSGGRSGGGSGGGATPSKVIARGSALGYKVTVGKDGSIKANGKKTKMGIVNGVVIYTSGSRKGQPVLGWGDL